MEAVNQIEKEVKTYIDEYKNNSEDHYDFGNEHIKFVYKEAIELAKKYDADEETNEFYETKIFSV